MRLGLTPGVGNTSARKLLAAFGLPQNVFTQSSTSLRQVVSSAQSQALASVPDTLEALTDTTCQWLQTESPAGVCRRVLTLGDPQYPQSLLNLDDPPLLLYLLGNGVFHAVGAASPAQTTPPASQTALIDPLRCIAMVGSRNPTPQGAANARLFAKNLVQSGLTIVSGLALGIDGAAHEGALEGSQTGQHHAATMAVVGTGLDRVYPSAHRALAHSIAQNGLLISEYPLGTPPLTANFPKRNRLIAGLSQGTLVVEAALKSGSLITARLTSEQGKDVFAIPGSIHAAQSRGCHALIKQGAKLVESAQDVLEEMRWPSQLSSEAGVFAPSASNDDADPTPSLLLAMGFDPVGLDALQARTGLDTANLQAELMGLEIDGQVARLPGGLFQRQVV